jgi:hypothetical protein
MMGALVRTTTAWALVLAAGLAGCHSVGSPTFGLPAAVDQAEALAEDVQTDIAQLAWTAAEARTHELKSRGERLEAAGVPQPKRSAYRRAVDSLGAAITRRNRSDALTAGNHVSRIVTAIMADYPTKVPVQVVYMDVAGRDVLYAAAQGRWNRAAAPVAEVGASYAAVQAHVKARNPALDQQVSSEIGQLQRAVVARERDRATSLAQALLEDVDRIELTF